MAATTATAVLDADTVYIAFDRIVCGTARCAGSTAVATGRDLHGAKVQPMTPAERAEFAMLLPGSTCECGRLSIGDDTNA